MIVRRAHPHITDAAASVDLGDSDARAQLTAWYAAPRREWLRLNLVSSVNGSAAGADGTSDGLSNSTDRAILSVIRDASDVVLVGANSVRAEGYVVPKHADLAIVTSTGNFGSRGIPERRGAGRLLVLCPSTAEDAVRSSELGARAEVIVLETPRDQPIAAATIIDALRSRELMSIVCEGGPSLAGQLVGSNLVDELALTTSPRISPVALPLLGSHELPATQLSLEQLLIDESGTTYARWFVER